MIKLLYKCVGVIFTSFIIFIFYINFNFLSYKESIIIRIFYSIKINLIYYLFYLIYVIIYLKYLHKKS